MRKVVAAAILLSAFQVQFAFGQTAPLNVSKAVGKSLSQNVSAMRSEANRLIARIKAQAGRITRKPLAKGDFNGDGDINETDRTFAEFCRSQIGPVKFKIEGNSKLLTVSMLSGVCPAFDKNRDGIIDTNEMPAIAGDVIRTNPVNLSASTQKAIAKAQQAVLESSDKLSKIEDSRNLIAFGTAPDQFDFNKNFVSDSGDTLGATLCVNENKPGRLSKSCTPLDTNLNGVVTKAEATGYSSIAPPDLKLETPKDGASFSSHQVRVAGFCAPQYNVQVGIGLAGQPQRIGGPVFEDSKIISCNTGCNQATFIKEGLAPLGDITRFTPGCTANSVGTFETVLTLPSTAPSGDRIVQISNRYAVGDIPATVKIHFDFDTVRPSAITDLTPSNAGVRRTTIDMAAVQLQWTAPGDDGQEGQAIEYDLRYSKLPLDGTNFRQATRVTTDKPHQGGYKFESIKVDGLELSTQYYFAISTKDDADNWSAISNVASIVTSGPDTTKPGTVQDLTAYPGGSVGLPNGDPSSDVLLQWTTPGSDDFTGQAASYDLRYWNADLSPSSGLPQSNYDSGVKVVVPMVHPGGYRYDSVLVHLSPGRYRFALKTTDEFGNISDLSNAALAQVVLPDVTPPSRVTNLTAYVGGSVGLPNGDPSRDVMLQWTAPGDDGNVGQAAKYDLRYSTSPINDSNFASATSIATSAPHSAGHMFESVSLSLNPDAEYYFALKTQDEANNLSTLSNVVHVSLLPLSSVEGISAGQTIRGERLHLRGLCDTDYPVIYRPNSSTMLNVTEELTEPGMLRTECIANGASAKQGTYDFGPLVLIKKNDSCAAWQPCSASFLINQEANGVAIISKTISFKYASSSDGSLSPVLPRVLNVTLQKVHDRSARLAWTAPAFDTDSSLGGIPAAYDIRYSTEPITSTNVAQAKRASGEPTPMLAGTTQSFTLTGLNPGTTYYVSIQSQSDGINPASRSVPSVIRLETLPAQAGDSIDPSMISLVNNLPLRDINNLPMSADRDEQFKDEVAVGFPEEIGGVGVVRVYHIDNDPQGGMAIEAVDTVNYALITGDYSHRQFGRSVAIRGNTLIVGSVNSENFGWFHVFVRQANGSWAHTQQTRLDTNHVAGKYVTSGFASALGLSEDGLTLAVGNPSPDSAYIFYRTSLGRYDFSRQILPPSNIALNGSRFGASIAVSGGTVVVGAPNASVRGVQSGRVFVYDVTNGNRFDTGDLKPSVLTANAGFGSTVAIQGDTIVVGSARGDTITYGYSNNCTAPFAPAGLADIFKKEALSTPLPSGVTVRYRLVQSLFEPAAATDSCGASGFGTSVAIDGGRIAVGAPQAKRSATSSNTGAVYLFKADEDGAMGPSCTIDDAMMLGYNGGQNVVMSNGLVTATLPTGASVASSAVRTFRLH